MAFRDLLALTGVGLAAKEARQRKGGASEGQVTSSLPSPP